MLQQNILLQRQQNYGAWNVIPKTRTGGWEFWLLPWRWYILSIPLKAGRGTSAETCGLGDVFPPDDLGSGPCTPFIIYIPHIMAAVLVIKINSLIHTKS